MNHVQPAYNPSPSPAHGVHPGIGKGLDPRVLLAAIIIASTGVGIAAIGYLGLFSISWGRIPIPLEIVGAIVLIGGIVMAVQSFRAHKCLACRRPLDTIVGHYPPSGASHITAALSQGDLVALVNAPIENGLNDDVVDLKVEHCPGCRDVAVVSLEMRSKMSSTPLLPQVTSFGPPARVITDCLKDRRRREGA